MKHTEVQILMTRLNPTGHKLEELLRTLADEIDAKTANIAANTESAAKIYRSTNDHTAYTLRDLADKQEAAIKFAQANPFTPRSTTL
jgi:HEPN domain-containing protein